MPALAFLSGFKTYIMAATLVVDAVGSLLGYWGAEQGIHHSVQELMAGGTVAALRAGMK